MWLQPVGSMVTPCGYSFWTVWSRHVATASGQYGHTVWLQPVGSMVTPCGYSFWTVWSHRVATACGQYGHTVWLQPVGSMVTCSYSLQAVWSHGVATACGQYGHIMWYSLWAVWTHHVVQPVGSMVTPCGTACGQYGHTVSKFSPTTRVDNSSPPLPTPPRTGQRQLWGHLYTWRQYWKREPFTETVHRATKSWHCREGGLVIVLYCVASNDGIRTSFTPPFILRSVFSRQVTAVFSPCRRHGLGPWPPTTAQRPLA